MEKDERGLAHLSQLATSSSVGDRAFAASTLALGLQEHDRVESAAVYRSIRDTAKREHADVRARIRNGTFHRNELLATLERYPLELQDHVLEEILDIAYPPLDALALPQDLTPYSPSGMSEILFALDRSELGPGRTVADLGSGLGKVVLLAALLTGADAYGVELDPRLVTHATEAAAELGLDKAHFLQGDIRDAPLPRADVYYLFIPLRSSADVVARLAPIAGERVILVFSQPLDEKRVPFLRATSASSYWLTMYESSRSRSGK